MSEREAAARATEADHWRAEAARRLAGRAGASVDPTARAAAEETLARHLAGLAALEGAALGQGEPLWRPPGAGEAP